MPSITELLLDLCPAEWTVGRTKFCIHPDKYVHQIPRIGGTKNVHIDKVIELTPDIVFANKEENNKSDVDEIRKFCPVWVSDVPNIDAAHELIRRIGALFGKEKRALRLIVQQKKMVQKWTAYKRRSAVYLIWYRPLMTVGGDTYINDMMSKMGLENVFGDRMRYPEVTIEEIRHLKPDVLLLSSEPFPFKEKHISELEASTGIREVRLVDGQVFSWYGSRLNKVTEWWLK